MERSITMRRVWTIMVILSNFRARRQNVFTVTLAAATGRRDLDIVAVRQRHLEVGAAFIGDLLELASTAGRPGDPRQALALEA
jgi:hypothetical protein